MSDTPTDDVSGQTDGGSGPTDDTPGPAGDAGRTRRTRSDAIDTGALKYASGVVSLIGLWLVVSPLLFETTDAALWNGVIVGAAIFLLAGYNYYRQRLDLPASVGVASLVALLGLWTLLAAFILDMVSGQLLWSTAIAGVLTGVLSGYTAYAFWRGDAPFGTGTRA